MLATAAPARADDDVKGWFVALDIAMTQPNSLDQSFATHIDQTATPFRDTRLMMDNDSDMTYRASVGYGFGKGLGNLRVSYWSFDKGDEQAGTLLGGGVYPSVFGYGYNYGYVSLYNPAGVTYKATSKVKARAYDLDYVRPISVGEKFSVQWLVGLRVARYEEDQTFFGDSNGYPYGAATDFETKHFKSDAKGPRVGVTGVFGFGKHFSLDGSLAVSFLQADTDALATQTVNGTLEEIRRSSDDHIRGEIRDFDLKGVWSYGPLDYYIGYAASEWDGLVTDPLPASNCCGGVNPGSRGRQTVSFNSVHGGVTFRFGKRH